MCVFPNMSFISDLSVLRRYVEPELRRRMVAENMRPAMNPVDRQFSDLTFSLNNQERRKELDSDILQPTDTDNKYNSQGLVQDVDNQYNSQGLVKVNDNQYNSQGLVNDRQHSSSYSKANLSTNLCVLLLIIITLFTVK